MYLTRNIVVPVIIYSFTYLFFFLIISEETLGGSKKIPETNYQDEGKIFLFIFYLLKFR